MFILIYRDTLCSARGRSGESRRGVEQAFAREHLARPGLPERLGARVKWGWDWRRARWAASLRGRIQARRCGANPSPRSWPRICSCKCSGWHFEEMPGEVREVAARFRRRPGRHGDHLQRTPAGLRLFLLPCSDVPHLTRPRFARPPKAFAKANAGPASWRGIRAASSRLVRYV